MAQSSVTDAKPLEPTRGAQIFGYVFTLSLIGGLFWMVTSCTNSMKAKNESEAALAAELLNSASEADQRDVAELLAILVRERVLLKLVPQHESERAEMDVLPAFHSLTVDEKSIAVKACYLSAFGLPKASTKFPWPMAVMDGVSGKRIRTVDQGIMGLGW